MSMRRITPLSLALGLVILASLAAPPVSHSVIEPFVFCPAPVPECYADQDCDAYCQSSCPATPRGACQVYGRFGEGFCTCRS